MYRMLPYATALIFAAASVVYSQEPKLTGVVTDVGTPDAFRVNDVEVLCSTTTVSTAMTGPRVELKTGCEPHLLGQSMKVYGSQEKHTHEIRATKLEITPPETRKLEGRAVIERQPAEAAGEWTMRADGYQIVIPAGARRQFISPIGGMTDVGTNVWVRYSGKQRSDGALVAESVEFSANTVTSRESNLHAKREFDPAAPTEKDRQSGLSKAFLGLDPKRFPAYSDAALQERVQAIGARLVPAYQRALADDDPTKVHFRFQVVDQPKLHNAITLSNGIVLVPYQVIARLSSDDQVATVLADNIATALEKQEFRMIPATQKLTATEIAGIAGGFFVPGLGLATGIIGGEAASKLQRNAEEQSGRVSLDLLNDAGFRVAEAPVTWWLLASLKPKSIAKIPMPYRALYLYSVLSTVWASLPATSVPNSSVSTR